MSKVTEVLEIEDVGAAVHTALRKLCDSTPTTIAYCIISAMEDGWAYYLRAVRRTLKADNTHTLSWEPLSVAFQVGDEGTGWDEKDFRGLKPREVSLVNALHAVFRLFDECDWGGFSSYVDGAKFNLE